MAPKAPEQIKDLFHGNRSFFLKKEIEQWNNGEFAKT